ncbi:Maf family nucleotide pyrophosphatase [Flagellimonas sp. DF-77]|uniref:Maf family nucleotide pyrophosphatase n=1 Tax=Flagellimonas algarum TaxID=3230298 RepID=UPI00339509D0
MTEHPLVKRLHGHRIVLASGSPRRKRFFEELGLPFEIRLKPMVEDFPEQLKGEAIASYLAELKASVHLADLAKNEILITSDTVVWHKGRSLAKAADRHEAEAMLKTLSSDWHEVITAVCFSRQQGQKTVSATTKVKFATLSQAEIDYYIQQCAPFDKAGAYGIQEWLGLIGIEAISGSYTNVVGLPTQLVYKTLMDMAP